MPTFLVLAHEEPVVFGRLVASLAPHRCIVHVDAGVPIGPFITQAAGREHVEFLVDRVDVRWAGYSMVEAMGRLMERGVAVTAPDDHLVQLSGTDALVRPIDEFVAHLRSAPARQHLRYVMLSEIDDPDLLVRIRRRHRFDLRLVPTKRRQGLGHRVNAAFRRAVGVIERVRPPGPCPAGLRVALGSNWFSLTSACAADLLGRRDPEVDRWFRTTFAPDETYFATLFAAGPFGGDNVSGGPEPFVARGMFRLANHHLIAEDLRRVFTFDDLDEVLGSGKYFVRKLRWPVSQTLLDALDHHRVQ